MHSTSLPLHGITVIDLTRLLPGPVLTMTLADLGARVIKVETPSSPDLLRFLPPHDADGVNACFSVLNRDKESVVVDLYSERGSEIVRKLVGGADVLVTSARRDWMEARGLGFESLRAENSRLVACSLEAYQGESQMGGHDINLCSVSGLSSLIGEKGAPVLPSVQLADLGGAQHALVAILAALFRRERTGEGCELHLSLEEGCHLYTLPARSLARFGLSSVGPLSGQSPLYRYYRCKDGKSVAFGAIEPKFQARIKEIVPIGTSHWPDEVFFGAGLEVVHRELEEMFASRTRDEWVEVFRGEDVCFSPVLDMLEVEGERRESGQPAGLFDSCFGAREVSAGARGLGADTAGVLGELGYSAGEVERLVQGGVVVVG